MKTSLTINDDLWWKFQEEIARRRKTQKDAVEEALAAYVSESPGAREQKDHAAKAVEHLTKSKPTFKRGEKAG